MTANKAQHSTIVFEQIILENFVQGCTYAAVAWTRRSSEPTCRRGSLPVTYCLYKLKPGIARLSQSSKPDVSYASSTTSAESATGLPISSTIAIGALSPERKPHFRMRK